MKKLKFSKDSHSRRFYSDLQQKVYKVLGENPKTWGPDIYFWMKACFWFLSCWGTYTVIVMGMLEGSTLILAALLVYVSGLLFGFSIGHDASHGVLFRKKQNNWIIHFISFLTVGVDPTLWGLRHIRSHHIYPNVEGSDIDIDKNPLLRLSPTHPWTPKHRYQHLYAPLAYAAALAHSVFWGDWIYLIHPDYDWMRRGKSKRFLVSSFLLFKFLHFVLMIVIPWLLLPYDFWIILLTYFTCGSITSLLFIIMLVGTHFFPEADYLSIPPDKQLSHSWAIHNLRTSCDWNPKSSLARFISGGANCHAAHHLFPKVCHTHYGKLNSIIEEVTEQYGVTYHRKSLLEMINSHLTHLREMGRINTDAESRVSS